MALIGEGKGKGNACTSWRFHLKEPRGLYRVFVPGVYRIKSCTAIRKKKKEINAKIPSPGAMYKVEIGGL
jgi:hypothetical protein